MTERTFKYHSTTDLIAQVKELGQLLTSGSGPTVALKNSHTGFLKQTGEVSQRQLRNLFMCGRYEIWLRGRGVDGKDADATCAALEAQDPRRERNMTIRTTYDLAAE